MSTFPFTSLEIGSTTYASTSTSVATTSLVFSDVPDAGLLKIKYGTTAKQIAFDDEAADLQTQLRAITGLEDVIVSGSYTDGFLITFWGLDVDDVEAITDNGSTLAASMVAVTFTITDSSFVSAVESPGALVKAYQVVLNHDNIIALPTTPVDVTPTPDAGIVIVPLASTFSLAWTDDYASIDATASMHLTYDSGTEIAGSALLEDDDEVSALLADGADAFATLAISKVVGPTADNSGVAVQLLIDNGMTGVLTGGDPANLLTVTVYYIEVAV